MLPHSFDDLPHASDDAINFTKIDYDKLEPSLLTANTLFIKIHGKKINSADVNYIHLSRLCVSTHNSFTGLAFNVNCFLNVSVFVFF